MTFTIEIFELATEISVSIFGIRLLSSLTWVPFSSSRTPSAKVYLVADGIADAETLSNLFCVAQCPGVNKVSGRLAGVCAQAARNNQARGT